MAAKAKPLTTEAIAFTEKKMDMALDDIIKMSKKTATKENKAPRRPIKSQCFLNGIASRRSNKVQHFMDSRSSIKQIKSQGFLNTIASQRNSKVQHFMDSRSSIRQGVLAQRRSNFRGNQFPLTANAAKRAAAMPIRNMAIMPLRNMADNWKKPRHAPGTALRKAADSGVARKDTAMGSTKRRPQTMDALFANMKEKRMMIFSSRRRAFQDDNRQNELNRRRAQQQQMRGGGGRNGGRWFGNFFK